jgi:hypothetical protein
MADYQEQSLELTPQQYFDLLKERKYTITDEELLDIYDNCLILIDKYRITGQKKGIQKLMFHLETIEKEREIVKMGINTFVYKDDIEEYIDSVSKDTVKIIELENYEREIPDQIVDIIAQVKQHFTQLYVLFTDYTGKVERQVAKERRDKDPILFGTFQEKDTKTIIDRFYFLGDWEDEYCDLTLDKMVNQIKLAKDKDIIRRISTPKTLRELKEQLEAIDVVDNKFIMQSESETKPTLFKKIRTFLRF